MMAEREVRGLPVSIVARLGQGLHGPRATNRPSTPGTPRP